MSQSTMQRPVTPASLPRPAALDLLEAHVARLHGLLERHSVSLLRVNLGLVFLVFGVLKFFPGYSPAAEIAAATLDRLTFGLLHGHTAVLVTAVTETVIGLTLVTGRFLRLGLVVLAGAMVGIMAPLVLFTGELFPHGPSLMGQYVLKDVVLVAAGLVVAAQALGSRLRHDS
jgi:uncharacterized membrane protein YphA (DoxX/SURF4 family)